jgi:hypothetical protein
MGSDQEVGQDHRAGAHTLALGGMVWQERIQRFNALTGKADLAVKDAEPIQGTTPPLAGVWKGIALVW